jgi:hypothetical protein
MLSRAVLLTFVSPHPLPLAIRRIFQNGVEDLLQKLLGDFFKLFEITHTGIQIILCTFDTPPPGGGEEVFRTSFPIIGSSAHKTLPIPPLLTYITRAQNTRLADTVLQFFHQSCLSDSDLLSFSLLSPPRF